MTVQKNTSINIILRVLVVLVVATCSACSSMLPTGEEKAKSPWNSFDDAQASFDQVYPDETTVDELSDLGFDPRKTPNIRILNYLDVLNLFKYEPGQDRHYPQGVVACLKANESCYGYDVNIKDIQNKRVGNFWLDIFAFKREEHQTGWNFRALFLMVDEQVVYKLAGGNPRLDASKKTNNPLGPIQGIGPDMIELNQ